MSILDIKIKKNKKIKFNFIVRVLSIPNRQEIFDFNLREKLWWSKDELEFFKKNSYDEVFNLIQRHKFMTIKQASKLLYQPGSMTIIYDKNNFD